jgi:hypothetical protein
MGYACVAEARAFYSLGLNPLNFKWIDLFLEYRMLSNHNDRMNWGKQLVDGKVKFFAKPKNKWDREGSEDSGPSFKPTHSLAEATYKLTGEIRDTKEKDDFIYHLCSQAIKRKLKASPFCNLKKYYEETAAKEKVLDSIKIIHNFLVEGTNGLNRGIFPKIVKNALETNDPAQTLYIISEFI